MNPDGNGGLRVLMGPCKVVHVWGTGGAWEISVLPASLCWEPKLISKGLLRREIKILTCVSIFLILWRLVTERLNVLAGILGCELGCCGGGVCARALVF